MATIGQTVAPQYTRKYVWELPIRITHWATALAICVLFTTGQFIAAPILASTGEPYNHFWMGRVRGLHYICGYVLTAAVLWRFYWYFAGNNYARSGTPMFWKKSWYRALGRQFLMYFKLQRGGIEVGHNSLAGFCYLMFLLMCMFEALTGFALFGKSNPGGFWDKLAGWCVPLLGGSFAIHTWHHLVAWLITVFVIVHIYVVFYDSHLFNNGLVDSIVAGPKFCQKDDIDADKWVS